MVIMTTIRFRVNNMRKPNTVSVAEAKKSLSELLGKVAYGNQSFTIVKRGRPMARLVPAAGAPSGLLSKGWMEDDDPFLKIIEDIVAERHSRRPRQLRATRK